MPFSIEQFVLHAAPLSHGAGCYGLPHIARGAVSIIPDSGHFDPAEIARLLRRWQGVSFFAAPTMVTRSSRGFSALPQKRRFSTVSRARGSNCSGVPKRRTVASSRCWKPKTCASDPSARAITAMAEEPRAFLSAWTGRGGHQCQCLVEASASVACQSTCEEMRLS